MTSHCVNACAPGKLIVIGEHAVVSGAPAMALALKRYTRASISRKSSCGAVSIRSSFSFSSDVWGPYELNSIKGSKSSQKSSLHWAEAMLKHFLPDGFQEELEWELYSEIEPGHGMGSSAAAICSSFAALASFFKTPWAREQVWPVLTQIESLCHGKSSGIDIATSLQGGAIRFQQGKFASIQVPEVSCWYLYDSGRPLQTTKECVLHTQAKFDKDPLLLEEMTALSTFFIESAAKAGQEEMHRHIRLWNEMQTRLGVVPEETCHFIKWIESLGASAKVCGAGALSGKGAGLILVIASTEVAQKLKEKQINLKPVEVDHAGACVTLLG